ARETDTASSCTSKRAHAPDFLAAVRPAGREYAVRLQLRARGDLLAAEHGPDRKEPAAPGPLVLIVVDEFERPLAKLEHRDVGRGAPVDLASVRDRLEDARRIHGAAGNHLVERHTEVQELRHDVWEIDDLRRPALGCPVGGERIRPEARLHDALDDIPSE